MNPGEHPADRVVNISSGKIAPGEINLERALDVGKLQMIQFENGWPENFYDPISKQVTTMAVKKKQLLLGGTNIVDQEAIYARVIGLLVSN